MAVERPPCHQTDERADQEAHIRDEPVLLTELLSARLARARALHVFIGGVGHRGRDQSASRRFTLPILPQKPTTLRPIASGPEHPIRSDLASQVAQSCARSVSRCWKLCATR